MDDLFEKVLHKEIRFQGDYLDLEILTVELPDHRQGKREIVRAPDAVAVFPIDGDGKVYLVRQYRPAVDQILLEIPAGIIDAGETKEEAAGRECREEIGYHPGKLTPALTYAHAEGYSTGWITLFLGEILEPAAAASLDATEFLKSEVMPFEELQDLVAKGDIKDSKTILGTLLWAARSN